jgi:hypothetical protein
VTAADFVAPPAVTAAKQQQQNNHRRGPSHRASSPWSEWGTGAWTGTRAAAWRASGGRGPSYDENQVGFVDGWSGRRDDDNDDHDDHDRGGAGGWYYYYNGVLDTRLPPSPNWQPYEDLASPYEDRSSHSTHQVPGVQVHQPQPQPQWTPARATLQVPRQDAAHDDPSQGQGRGLAHAKPPPSPQRDLSRVSRGGLSVNEDVSPLSSTGSGMPYPRMSAVSGIGGGRGGAGWEPGLRVSRG